MPGIRFPWLPTLALLATFGGAAHAADTPVPGRLADWPAIHGERPVDPALEQRVRTIVAGMSLAQKIGQMTQAEIKSITPAQVKQYYIGSVLNGGGSWPEPDC